MVGGQILVVDITGGGQSITVATPLSAVGRREQRLVADLRAIRR